VKMASPSRRLHAPINTRERNARPHQAPIPPPQGGGGEHASEEVVVVAGYKWVWRGWAVVGWGGAVCGY
jgi:hypothetical protein